MRARKGTSLERRNAFSGRVINVDVERVELPNGVVAELEIVRHPGGAAAVAVNAAGEVCLLRQYRHALSGWLWELPAGKLDGREDPLFAAQRELAEEAGMRGAQWAPLGEFVSSPGVFSEVVHLYLAIGLEPTPARPEASEVFEVQWIAFERALALALAGEIRDGKTVVGLVRAAEHLKATLQSCLKSKPPES